MRGPLLGSFLSAASWPAGRFLRHVSLCKRDVGYLQVGCGPYVRHQYRAARSGRRNLCLDIPKRAIRVERSFPL